MTDLTEQWRKGELPEGWYWVEGCRDKEIYAYTSEYLNHMYRPKNSDRIIEQVPSYKEWKEYQNLDEDNKRNSQLAIQFSIEVDTLKELLKGCSIANTALVGIMDCFRKSPITEQRENCEKIFEYTQKLQKQLDEVLK